MITDLPTAEDFRQSGVGFLNLAWEAALDLALNLDDWNVAEWDDDGSVTDDYWKAAQRPLATAIALAQQGIELLLKARIADISPFLLVLGSPKEWPRGCDTKDMPFSDYRTIDAQDLIRAHDAVTNRKLSESFKERYERFRRLRNTIFHTVNKTLRIAPMQSREIVRFLASFLFLVPHTDPQALRLLDQMSETRTFAVGTRFGSQLRLEIG